MSAFRVSRVPGNQAGFTRTGVMRFVHNARYRARVKPSGMLVLWRNIAGGLLSPALQAATGPAM